MVLVLVVGGGADSFDAATISDGPYPANEVTVRAANVHVTTALYKGMILAALLDSNDESGFTLAAATGVVRVDRKIKRS